MNSLVRNQVTAAQVLDLENSTVNPLTGQKWPSSHDEILQSRRRLPVYQRYQEILDAYHRSQVMILSSATGSGKSTQVPQLLAYDEYASKLLVACTQPRRLAAKALAQRVADEMAVILGEYVGYKIGGDQVVNKNKVKSRIVYLTEGVLCQQRLTDIDLSAYGCIIIDEAHERTVELDLLLSLLKRTLNKRKDLKVVIMSATIDAKKFQEYFDNCPLVHITARNFSVDIKHLQPVQTVSNLVVRASTVAVDIHENKPDGNILVFLPGKEEIEQACKLVRKYTQNLDVYALHSAMSLEQLSLALYSSGSNRKCIMSTNIAETSLTIDNTVYVIDAGLSRQLIFNPRFRMDMLEMRPISQASARQRAGRAGRTRNGTCYRLYSKEYFDSMSSSTEPAIRSSSLDKAILMMMASGYLRMIDFDWIDAPHPESIARAILDLMDRKLIGADGRITHPGQHAARCPLDPVWYHALKVGEEHGCSLDILDLALLCSSQASIFLRPGGYKQAAGILRKAFAHPLSDHLTLANAFHMYLQCSDHALNKSALDQVYDERQRVGRFMQAAKIAPTKASFTDMTTVRKALAIAFCTQAAILVAGDAYRTVPENGFGLLSQESSLVGQQHEWIVYTTMHTSGSKAYLKIATAINAEWLVDLPFFQEDRLPKKGNGEWRQPSVKASLDTAKAAIEATKPN